ncbi:MAG: NADH:ubiquinone oxidoreductase, Na(+)-translocating, subunit [Bacteroidetes bacterium]|nr:NADH:ubiquinone oxidoreductase, Na(+)-translocating, subunit [Bacteroidota bacterium]
MSKTIKIKKGFDINLIGKSQEILAESESYKYALRPKDYIGISPKLLVQEGDRVKAGSPVFFSKTNGKIIFTSPVSGVVESIVRGEKRVIEYIKINADKELEYEDFGKESLAAMNREKVVEKLLISGAWTTIRQRPYSIIPNPESTPKCIIISGFDSSPLAPDYSILLKGKAAEMQLGIDVLSKLTVGKIHVNIHSKQAKVKELLGLQNVQINTFEGPHPVGNVSLQISKLDPINKGETIWYINPQDVVMIGNLFLKGILDTERIIALTGSEVKNPQYFKGRKGMSISSLVEDNVNKESHKRYISGNVLTGTKIDADGYLGAYDNQITVIKEGDYYEFLGWIMPGIKKFSFSRTFVSGFLKYLPSSFRKPIEIDTNLHGGERAFVVTGEFEKVFPFDIYPLQLIKACIIEDIDQMEQLGIYEIDAEDFALCEVIDPSKTEIQKIIRNGLELIRKEMGE